LSISAISRRYARALVELGAEQKCVTQYGEEMARVSEIYQAHPDFAVALESPTFSLENKSALLREVLGKLNLSEGMNKFLGLLLKKNRLRFLPSIQQSYQDISDELSGVVRAKITAAKKLAEDQLKAICDVLEKQTGKKVLTQTATDPELLGGIQIEIGGKLYDGTVKTQLKRIADTLKKG